jgi:hypothetical protein
MTVENTGLPMSAMLPGLHVCYRGGALVPAAGFIPDDRSDHVWSAGLRDVGCNSIHCGHCGGPVQPAAPGPRGERRYACACAQKTVYTTRFLAGEPEDRPDGLLPEGWSCGGHPPRALPVILDGLEVPPAPDWSAWIARAAHGGLTPVSPPPWLPPRPHAWLERLLATVSSSERARFGDHAVATIVGGLAGADVAIELSQRLRLPAVRQAIISLVADGAFDWRSDRARARAVVGLLEQTAGDEDSEALVRALRSALLGGPSASGVMYALARRDPAWLADAAVAVITANPNFTDRLLTALGEVSPVHVATALERLIDARLGARADLERAALRSFGADEAAAWSTRLEGFR